MGGYVGVTGEVGGEGEGTRVCVGDVALASCFQSVDPSQSEHHNVRNLRHCTDLGSVISLPLMAYTLPRFHLPGLLTLF
jgi:hypothetical protein